MEYLLESLRNRLCKDKTTTTVVHVTHEKRGLPRFGQIRGTRRPAHAQPQKAA